MKFGKRQSKDHAAGSGAPAPEPVAPVADPVVPAADPLAGYAPAPEPAPVAEPAPPAAEPELVAHDEPVVEGEAFELFTDDPPPPERAPAEALPIHRHDPPPRPPDPMPFRVAEQPVAVVAPGAAAAPVTTLGEAGEAYASGHAAGPGPAFESARPGPGPSWQEPVMELANERPELVVGAAFAGGLVAAMILRRLGH